jgi:hypothetical protein
VLALLGWWCCFADGRHAGAGLANLLLLRTWAKPRPNSKFRIYAVKNRAINLLSAARLFHLFGAQVWFVVALPVYLSSVFGWDVAGGAVFLAAWVFGIVQFRPVITGKTSGQLPDGRAAFAWAAVLAGLPATLRWA